MNVVSTLVKSTLFCLFFATSAAGAQWISLGDGYSELDISSITQRNGVVHLRMRHKVRQEKGVMTMDLNLAVDCKGSLYYIESGQISSDWSSRVAPMPAMPDDQRTFQLPTPNPAFNNMYAFVCP
jgi:hypothetical protein